MTRHLRAVVKLTEGDEHQINFTDFQDELCDGALIALPSVSAGTDRAWRVEAALRWTNGNLCQKLPFSLNWLTTGCGRELP